MKSATMRSGILITMALLFTAILIILAPGAHAQTADEGAEIYSGNCARCHKADGLGEPNKFPPLTGNPDAADLAHVTVVVTNGLEGKVILGVTYDRTMPAFEGKLTPEQIQLVSEYTTELSVSGAPTTPTTPDSGGDGDNIGEAAPTVGDDLFRGTKLLSNGGVACVACHSAGDYNRLGGPGLAIDLNGIIDDFGVSGFVDAITDPVAPPMVAVFLDHPITENEALSLAAFLEPTSVDDASSSSIDLLTVFGLLGLLVLVLITGLIVRGPQRAYVTKLRSSR
ncbi:MAG: cytochrome c [Actinomycetia bacterium]|nr:cytochrome c [Actinomycetes bacterium]